MRIYPLCFALLALLATPAAAFTVEGVSETELRRYTAILAEYAGNSQWQQLWRNSRQQGYFNSSGPHPRFTLPMREIPALVRQTLEAPDHMQVQALTTTRLRRDFNPTLTGLVNGTKLTAICLFVDWRGAPEKTSPRPLQAEDLFYVSLVTARPC